MIIAPSERGIALLCVNAVFCTLAITAYVLRFINNLSRVRKGLLPWGHFIIIDSLVFAATVFYPPHHLGLSPAKENV